jgi:hypothetical protein
MRLAVADVKRAARGALKRHYLAAFVVAVLLVLTLSGPLSVSETIRTSEALLAGVAERFPDTWAARAIDDVLDAADAVQQATSLGDDSSRGKLHAVYARAEDLGGTEQVAADVLQRLLDGEPVAVPGILLRLAVLALTYVFVGGLARIGALRFFLESRLVADTPVSRILSAYRSRQWLHLAGLVLLKRVRLILWGLTLVGLPVKHYAWYLTDAIAAENPTIGRRQALRTSAALMRGHKWRVFLFDLSFLPWYLLSIVTFGAVKYLWLDPYYYSAQAEVYSRLRARAKAAGLPEAAALTDDRLFIPAVRPSPDAATGPARRPTLARPGRLDLTYLFFLFSFLGWVYEVLIELVELGTFVNRGSLYGPWIPIYGVGGVAIVLLLRRLAGNPLQAFFGAMVVGGVIEYAGAVLLWHFKHLTYWDYHGYFLNFQGRIALESLLSFGLFGVAVLDVIAPWLVKTLSRCPRRLLVIVAAVLAALFLADAVVSQLYPHVGEGITRNN